MSDDARLLQDAWDALEEEGMPGTAADAIGAHRRLLAAERKRADDEAKWRAVMRRNEQTHLREYEEMKTRAEQAERERDEARLERTEYSVRLIDANKARERAEADNAALLARLQAVARKSESFDHAEACGYSEDIDESDEDFVPCTCSVGMAELCVVGEIHPGAALLERMRALETFRSDMAKAVDGWGHADECPAGFDDEPEESCDCVNGEVRKLLEKVKP